MEKISLLLFSLLFLALSLEIHARESRFFAKTTRIDASEEPATALPPQGHVGHGLYGRDPDQFPSYTNNNNAAHGEPNSIPSNFADVDFAASYDNYKERPSANNVPSSFPDSRFSTDTYDNKGRGVDNIHSTFADVDFAASYDNYKRRSKANNVPEFPNEAYENKEFSEPKSVPTTFSDEEFRRYEAAKVPDYSSSYGKRYGMSDTRFLENGKYFYDVNAERSGGEGRGPMKESSERYGSYGGKNEYPSSSEENEEIPEEFVP